MQVIGGTARRWGAKQVVIGGTARGWGAKQVVIGGTARRWGAKQVVTGGTARRWGAKQVEPMSDNTTRVMRRTLRRRAAVVGTARPRAAPVGTAPYDTSDERTYCGVQLKPHGKYIRISSTLSRGVRELVRVKPYEYISISGTCPIVSLDGARWPPPPRGALWKGQWWLTRCGRLINELIEFIIQNSSTESTTAQAWSTEGRVTSARPRTRRVKPSGQMKWRAASARCMTWRVTTATSTATTAEPTKRKTNKDV